MRPGAAISFALADVTRPLEPGPWDLVYCRYLLTHLAAPERVVVQWSEGLSTDGLILIEENDWIRAAEPVFTRYLEIVATMLASQGQQLYVGAQLDRLGACHPTQKALQPFKAAGLQNDFENVITALYAGGVQFWSS